MTTKRVVLHASTAESLSRARRNVQNLLASRPNTEVLIVANAGAVSAALETLGDHTDQYLRLCRNSLIAQGLTNDKGIEEIEAAVVTLMELQTIGWAYIHA